MAPNACSARLIARSQGQLSAFLGASALRIALISAFKRTNLGELRAETELVGRSVLAWQVDLALDIGCERIICFSDSSHGEVIAQQRRIEGTGLAFHVVRNHLQIASLVRPEDYVFVQLDGLVLGDVARELVGARCEADETHIFAISASHSLSNSFPTDFERIDKDSHWAGVALLPGACTAALEDFPGEGEAMSLLLRLGLQARVGCADVAPNALENDNWLLASDNEALGRREDAAIRSSLPQISWSGPSAFVATKIVSTWSPLRLRSGSEISAGLGLVVMVVAAVIAGLGQGIVGLGTAAIGAFVVSLSAQSVALRSRISVHTEIPAILRWFTPATGGLATAVLILAQTGVSHWPVHFGIPFLTMGLAWVVGMDSNFRLRAFWGDLPFHLGVFSISAVFGVLLEVMILFSLGALLQLMMRARTQSAKSRS